MNTNVQPAKFVVLGAIDGILSDRVALAAARFSASILGGELHLVHVIALPPAGVSDTMAALTAGRARLEEAGASARAVSTSEVLGHVAAGDPCEEILETADRLKADLVLVGTHGRTGLDRLLLGSVAEQVVRRASCPVLVVREKNYPLAKEVEAPCADCVESQVASMGKKRWCVRHSQRHPHAHTHYETPQSFALGSSIIRPD